MAAEITKQQKKGLMGCLGCFGILFIALCIIIIVAINNAGKEEQLTDEERAEINNIISEFEGNTGDYIAATNGVVKRIEMLDIKDSDTFSVHVYIDEASWAKSTESEKASVAATIGRQMEQLAAPTKIYMSIISDANGDKLASPKITSEGYKIIR
ncbi:hypothetical protein [Lysinibacillus odysseyi]|uniref:Uncharacterized protein n=1 Tax=Lysinibacillus odysseyi 34hs-1 = NBRC 100172 TaxID=1220589 RepID=A0A0A3IUG2_9BACI|nr:hypothetical protein [Lysinibacillus odysseyi]KGR88389.1 hypothetical protein CD32_01625 [Lysinibacillus odysseyi 34hs-1 = NBRC 100172]